MRTVVFLVAVETAKLASIPSAIIHVNVALSSISTDLALVCRNEHVHFDQFALLSIVCPR